MSTETLLQLIGRVVRETGGYLTMPDGMGGELVVVSRQKFEEVQRGATEVQLSLAAARPASGGSAAIDALERINREIALYYVQQLEADDAGVVEEMEGDISAAGDDEMSEEADEPAGAAEPAQTQWRDDLRQFKAPVRPPGASNGGRKVRFEPLRGDLSPDLQE